MNKFGQSAHNSPPHRTGLPQYGRAGGAIDAPSIRNWIFVYFFLLIFEGAVRKWLFFSNPAMSSALMIVRDPVVLIIYFLAWRDSAFPAGLSMKIWGVLLLMFSGLGVLQFVTNSWLPLVVVVYGVRCYCLHIPLIFIMGEVLQGEDCRRICRWILLLAGPMAVLMVVQFGSGPDSFLNRSTQGEDVMQISSALGKIRPPGTFSFINGAWSFFLLVEACLLYSFVRRDWFPSWLRITALGALVCVLPISGSRGLVLGAALLMVFALLGGLIDGRLLGGGLVALALGFVGFGMLLSADFFKEGLLVFSTRWNDASTSGGSLATRLLEDFLQAFEHMPDVPLLGYGIGIGSNVAAKFIAGGFGFLLAESEWDRTVLELGPIMAVVWLGARTVFGLSVLGKSWASLRSGRSLPWLLFGAE